MNSGVVLTAGSDLAGVLPLPSLLSYEHLSSSLITRIRMLNQSQLDALILCVKSIDHSTAGSGADACVESDLDDILGDGFKSRSSADQVLLIQGPPGM